jgi:predicted nucleic acid-binding protein
MSEAESAYGGPVLLDSSAWVRVGLGRLAAAAQARFAAAIEARELVVSPPFAFEARYSARDGAAFRSLQLELRSLPHAWAGDRTWEVAEDAQQALAEAPGISHRISTADLLLAAIADQSGLGVLHYDHDFDLIREHTPLEFRSVWIAERGSL